MENSLKRISGIDKVWMFKITSWKGLTPTYSNTPIFFETIQEVEISPEQEKEDARGGGVVVETFYGALSEKVKMTHHKITDEQKRDLLGYVESSSGLITRTSKARPEFGVVFTGYDEEGNKKVFVLHRGQFDHISESYKQKTDKIDIGSDTIEGVFKEVKAGQGTFSEGYAPKVTVAKAVSEIFKVSFNPDGETDKG